MKSDCLNKGRIRQTRNNDASVLQSADKRLARGLGGSLRAEVKRVGLSFVRFSENAEVVMQRTRPLAPQFHVSPFNLFAVWVREKGEGEKKKKRIKERERERERERESEREREREKDLTSEKADSEILFTVCAKMEVKYELDSSMFVRIV